MRKSTRIYLFVMKDKKCSRHRHRIFLVFFELPKCYEPLNRCDLKLKDFSEQILDEIDFEKIMSIMRMYAAAVREIKQKMKSSQYHIYIYSLTFLKVFRLE